MSYGLNDNTVKRIASVAYHQYRNAGGSMEKRLSNIFGDLSNPSTINQIAQAHTTDAMQHKFANKDEENTFKRHLAAAAAMNRGTMNPVPSPK
jgi:hypothetical protein